MGHVSKVRFNLRHRTKSASAINDAWQRRATEAAIEAARKIVTDDAIPAGTPIGRLGRVEWGWLVAAVLFGWISTRAEQAVAEGIDVELAVRMTDHESKPWHAGVIASILPDLAEIPGFDFNMPLSRWSRESMTGFLLAATRLIHQAEAAADRGAGITHEPKATADV